MLIGLIWISMQTAVFGSQTSDANRVCSEVVGLLATDFQSGAKSSEGPRIEVRQCSAETGAHLQILAWQGRGSRPTLMLDTNSFGVVQAAAKSNIFLVETGGATRNTVFVIEYKGGEPKLVVKRVTRGTAKIAIEGNSFEVTIGEIFDGDSPPRSETYRFVVDSGGTRND